MTDASQASEPSSILGGNTIISIRLIAGRKALNLEIWGRNLDRKPFIFYYFIMGKNDLVVSFNRYSQMIIDIRDELDSANADWMDPRIKAMLNTKLQEAQLLAMVLCKSDTEWEDTKRHELSQEPIIFIPDWSRIRWVKCPCCNKDSNIAAWSIETWCSIINNYLCWDCGTEFTN